ncbi:hypothetical protein PHYSODRAFT_326150 [Phytophthora sojae]|uniref:Uncharacterized protein n=1 Tax=Phytophthora sojae (strain P6497) TaxID=1094619 RepID=G4YXT8_PHYSP|nr:hypothetical protein PHYSODRAFT_326150 [Phytophthora sojae]EGZ25081.1 hypothetical protein PHYSODRAFT_326150 [Phytophthora sojae]|eukprot:XP_009520369.1 hypothetical protein PHYSODRAFT_326150 [Phytophthora sojae]
MPATPHARAPPPAPSSPSAVADCVPVDDEEAARAERDDVERRRFWLLKMPQLYAPKHRQRYVFLNLDNTAASMFMSRSLFRAIAGAQCPHDVRLNFEALTDRLCGSSSSAVVMHQLATFSKTSPAIARALEKFGWTLKPVGNDDQALQEELLKQLHKGAATANGKTLVLATGGGGLGTGHTSAYQEIISKFLVEGWHVEIHAWLRAVNDGYLRLQSENPGRVVVKPLDDVIQDIAFLNKNKKKKTGAKHVCSVLNQEESPLTVAVSSPASDTASIVSICNTSRSDGSPRAISVSPILKRAHSIPPATSPNASWIKAAMHGQQEASVAAQPSDRPPASTFTSQLEAFAAAATFSTPRPRAESSPPVTTFTPSSPPTASPAFSSPTPTTPASPSLMSPFAPMPSQPAYRWMLWELQLQQMRELISAQQADLAMRQCALQQTTELMRLMQDQDKKQWQPAASFQQQQQPSNPLSGTWGF